MCAYVLNNATMQVSLSTTLNDKFASALSFRKYFPSSLLDKLKVLSLIVNGIVLVEVIENIVCSLLELPLLVTVPIVPDSGMLTLYVASSLILSTPRYVITPQSHHYSMLCRYSTAMSLLHD